ncbi:MAG: tyrosine--tRNA ligase [Candidatus Melainabacteria bacterium]|nr:tyrosine--tRNA ligase [Candidatus Melainabacteria bacterium]
MTQIKTQSDQNIPDDILDEAAELSRGAEILPEGMIGLAKKIHAARKENRVLRVKLGIDPTSTDLHLGHSVVFRKLRRFQEYGHQVVLIIGGFTAQIGDPSGRNATRPPLTREQVEENAKTYLDQMGLILDLEKTELRNNADWLAPLNLNDLLKLASLVTINQLLAKEAFGDRFEKHLPVSFHELFYPLLQGYDSVAVNADVELGGTDQRFNILQGRELQPHYMQDQQIALLVPLLEGTDGVIKMSKTYGNFIALNFDAFEMFSKVMSIPDGEANGLIIKYFELATTLSGDEIDKIHDNLKKGGNPKDAKLALARQITLQYHGEQKAEEALTEWQRIFSLKQKPSEIDEFSIAESKRLVQLLVDADLISSSSEAKKMIEGGGIRIDDVQVRDKNHVIELEKLPLVLAVGKRAFVRVVAQ